MDFVRHHALARSRQRLGRSLSVLAIAGAILATGCVAAPDSSPGPSLDASGGSVAPPPSGTGTGDSKPASPSASWLLGAAPSYQDDCDKLALSHRRCSSVVSVAVAQAGIDRDNVEAIELLPMDPNTGLEPGQARFGGGPVALVRFHLLGSDTLDQEVWCVGVSFSPSCNESAEIFGQSGLDMDVPCSGEPPGGCATLPPPPRPESVAGSEPFQRKALDVPIDRLGDYRIRVGHATIPDGRLTERGFRIDDPRPETYWIAGGPRLEIESDVAGRERLGSIYREGFDGPEPVTIYLAFTVTEYESPGVLQVRDIVVR